MSAFKAADPRDLNFASRMSRVQIQIDSRNLRVGFESTLEVNS